MVFVITLLGGIQIINNDVDIVNRIIYRVDARFLAFSNQVGLVVVIFYSTRPLGFLAAKAEIIITGDKDLLVLHPWQGILILNPADALQRLGG